MSQRSRSRRRLAYFGYARDSTSKRHYLGIREVAREHGYPCTRHLVSRHYDESRDQWVRFIEYVKRSQASWDAPLGVGFGRDEVCRSVASECLTMVWVIPEQLAMVGCGNESLICNAIHPHIVEYRYGRSAMRFPRLQKHFIAAQLTLGYPRTHAENQAAESRGREDF